MDVTIDNETGKITETETGKVVGSTKTLNPIDIISDTTGKAIAAAIVESTEANKAYYKQVQPDTDFTRSWAGFKALCQQGAVGRYFNVGDQLQCKKGSDTLTWDIVHIGDRDDGQNYVILQMHDCWKQNIQFDEREAIFKATSNIPAGTYHFTTSVTGITDTSWTSSQKSGWSKTWQFTTTQTIPKGGVVCFARPKNLDTDLSTEGVSSYKTNGDTVAIETVEITEGTGGTDLATLGIINHAQRICYGYNRYAQSNIRQWLNSKADAGQWFTPQNDWDRPIALKSDKGFMNDIDQDFLDVVTKSKITTSINKISDNGGYDTTYDYFFLPCIKNLNGGDVLGIEDTDAWCYYTKFRMDGKTGINKIEDKNRIKKRMNTLEVVPYWWERTLFPTDAYGVNIVTNTGTVYAHGYACHNLYAAIACRIN